MTGILALSILMGGCSRLPVPGWRTANVSNDTAIAPLEAIPVIPGQDGNPFTPDTISTDTPDPPSEHTVELPEESSMQMSQTEEPDSDNNSLGDKLYRVTGNGVLWISISEDRFLEYAGFLKRKWGLNNAAVCGILANIQEESGFDPTKIGDSGASFGICQWKEERLEQMHQFCRENNLNPDEIETQLMYLMYELENAYPGLYGLLCSSTNSAPGAAQAARDFCLYYEAPSDPETASMNREIIAEKLLYPSLIRN